MKPCLPTLRMKPVGFDRGGCWLAKSISIAVLHRLFQFILLACSSLMTLAQTTSSREWLVGLPEVPPLRIPSGSPEWEVRRDSIRATLTNLLGDFPPRPRVPKVATVSRDDMGQFWRERFFFEDGVGGRVPGDLLVPKSSGHHAAIVYCHWHGGDYPVGRQELWQDHHTPEAPGPALAKRGYVVIAVDAPGFGERNGQGPDAESGSVGESSASKFHLWSGRTLWGQVVRDDGMALDYLLSRPEVDPARVGATGMSMGATRTWWLMALDDRLATGVAVACMTRYQDLIASDGLRHHGIYYFVPGILKHFDTEAVIACVAPRPILFMTGNRDAGSPVSGVESIEKLARPVWELYGASSNFISRVYPGVGHVYTPDMWERMLAWMDSHLKPTVLIP